MKRSLKKAHKEYKKFTQNDRLRDLYDSRVEAERRYITDIEYAEEKGKKEGKKEGKIEIAKKMLEQGLDTQVIKQTTNLSDSEIEKIKTELMNDNNS